MKEVRSLHQWTGTVRMGSWASGKGASGEGAFMDWRVEVG